MRVFMIFLSLSLTLSLSVLPGSPARAKTDLDSSFSATVLNVDEIRFLQGAMSYHGRYNGLLDGKWGPASQAALETMTRAMPGPGVATWRKTAKIAKDFERTLAAGRWQPRLHTATGFSVQLPTADMERSGGGDDRTFADKSNTLKLRTVVTSAGQTSKLHAKAVANSPGFKADYTLSRPDRLVTSTTLISGRTVYIRSDARDGGFATVVVEWKPERAPQARLIIASLRTGPQNALELPKAGVLARAIRRLGAKPVVSRPATRPATKPATKPARARHLAGTGFYINNTDLLSAAAVLDACEAPELADGSKLRRVRLLGGKEVVLLTSPARSEHWLKIGFPKVPDAGDSLSVSRFADPGSNDDPVSSPVLERAGGSVVMLMTPVEGTLRLLIAAPSGTDQLGAPVFDADGHLVAVTTSRPSQSEAALLGQMSLAAPATRLAAALRRSSILFADASRDTAVAAGSDSATEPDPAAIVPIFCR